jgi:hypothetical protein
VSTGANITLWDREFVLNSDGYPKYVLGELLTEWEGNKDSLLLDFYENLPHGRMEGADYSYDINYQNGTLVVVVGGHSLNEVNWGEECPAWLLLGAPEPSSAKLVLADCRYCTHLVDKRPKGTRDYIGGCEFDLRPSKCGKCQFADYIKFN